MEWIMLVTGASSGIGNAIAVYLASKGNLVYACARKAEDIDALNRGKNLFRI